MAVDVAPARRRCRVLERGDITVVAVDMLDGKHGVETEGQQPSAYQHRDRVPAAVGQLMGRDGAHQADQDCALDLAHDQDDGQE